MKDYYEILGVSPNSETEVITASYKAMMRKYHPDTNGAAEAAAKAKEINEAYEVLKSTLQRREYDAKRAQNSPRKNAPPPPPPPSPNTPMPEEKAPNVSNAVTIPVAAIIAIIAIFVLLGIILLDFQGTTEISSPAPEHESSSDVTADISTPDLASEVVETVELQSDLAIMPQQAFAGSNSAISADRHHEAYIKQLGAGDESGSGSQALILVDKATGFQRTLLVSRYNDDHMRNLTNLDTPLFSLDSGYVYVNSGDVSPYRSAVHQINLRTGKIRSVTSGWALSIIRTGTYRGYLLVQKHMMYDRPEGGAYNPVFVIRPDGQREFMVPGSANDTGELAVAPWLASKGWHAW